MAYADSLLQAISALLTCSRLNNLELFSDAAFIEITFFCFFAKLLPAVCVYHAILPLVLVGYRYLNSSVFLIAFDVIIHYKNILKLKFYWTCIVTK